MASGKNIDREARDRLRKYTARQSVHSHQVSRRRRDNILAIAGIVVIAAIATTTQIFYFTAGPGAPKASASASPTPSASAAAEKNVGTVPAKTIAEDRTWTGDLTLNDIALGISLDGKAAPQATSVFIDLAKKNFYTTTGSSCHRLTTSPGLKVIQCGSVNGDGTGDEGFTFGPVENAPADGIYPAGTIALARAASTYSQSTQFFITYEASTLPTDGGGYTVFGTVTGGLDKFISEIASKGVAATSKNTTDGPPAVTTKITAVTVK